MSSSGWAVVVSLAFLSGCATTRTSQADRREPAPDAGTAPAPEAVAPGSPDGGVEPAAESAPAFVPPPPRTPFTIPALEHDPAAAKQAYAAGKKALKDRDVATAIARLSECVGHDANRIDCLWELGWALYLDARWLDARDVWQGVARWRRDDPEVQGALRAVQAQADLQQRLHEAGQAAPEPLAPPPEGATVRLRAVGDVMLGTSFPEGLLPPDDGKGLLDAVKPLLQDADLTFVNAEGPFCDGGATTKCGRRKRSSCYAFRQPTHYADYLVEAGVDLASIANNHVGDFGDECRLQTQQTLTARGIAWSGPPGSIATVERNGVKVGLVAFHASPATNYLLDLPTAQLLVQLAARSHHLVVVSFHGGAEGATKTRVPPGPELFYGENRGDLRRFTHAVVDAGADLVLGHGPHVLRGMELYRGRLIAYSLGNFATYGPFTLSGPQGVGAILEAVLDGDGRFVSGKVFPTRQVGEGVPEPDPEGKALRYLRDLSQQDFPRSAVHVGDEGTLSAPSVEQGDQVSTRAGGGEEEVAPAVDPALGHVGAAAQPAQPHEGVD